MRMLLVGFDSAWTSAKSGAIVAVLRREDGTYQDLGLPRPADFAEAAAAVHAWQAAHDPSRTIILIDQPTIVANAAGQRPVENIVGSVVSMRFGGVQPANTVRAEMFGPDAPLWGFLSAFGGPADPFKASPDGTHVLETYPVLTLAALGWTLPHARAGGRLPKYNPARRSTFALADWKHVCNQAAAAMTTVGLPHLGGWLATAAGSAAPCKAHQDQVDACLCLLVALHWATDRPCLFIGELATGYMIIPHSPALESELRVRCSTTGRPSSRWVQVLKPGRAAPGDDLARE